MNISNKSLPVMNEMLRLSMMEKKPAKRKKYKVGTIRPAKTKQKKKNLSKKIVEEEDTIYIVNDNVPMNPKFLKSLTPITVIDNENEDSDVDIENEDSDVEDLNLFEIKIETDNDQINPENVSKVEVVSNFVIEKESDYNQINPEFLNHLLPVTDVSKDNVKENCEIHIEKDLDENNVINIGKIKREEDDAVISENSTIDKHSYIDCDTLKIEKLDELKSVFEGKSIECNQTNDFSMLQMETPSCSFINTETTMSNQEQSVMEESKITENSGIDNYTWSINEDFIESDIETNEESESVDSENFAVQHVADSNHSSNISIPVQIMDSVSSEKAAKPVLCIRNISQSKLSVLDTKLKTPDLLPKIEEEDEEEKKEEDIPPNKPLRIQASYFQLNINDDHDNHVGSKKEKFLILDVSNRRMDSETVTKLAEKITKIGNNPKKVAKPVFEKEHKLLTQHHLDKIQTLRHVNEDNEKITDGTQLCSQQATCVKCHYLNNIYSQLNMNLKSKVINNYLKSKSQVKNKYLMTKNKVKKKNCEFTSKQSVWKMAAIRKDSKKYVSSRPRQCRIHIPKCDGMDIQSCAFCKLHVRVLKGLFFKGSDVGYIR